MKRCLTLLLILSLCLLTQPAQSAPDAARQAAAAKLRQASDKLAEAHGQLQAMRDRIENIRHVSTINFQNNAYKVFMKGVLDVYGRVSAPGGWADAVSLVFEAVQSVWVEPALNPWGVRQATPAEQAGLDKMAVSALKSSGRIQRFTADLAAIMAAPLPRFDDDQPPLRSAKAWWRYPGDGSADDETELTTRKLNVIKNLSGKLVLAMDREMKELRTQRAAIIKLAEELGRTEEPAASGGARVDRAYLESLMPAGKALPRPPSREPSKESQEWYVSNNETFPSYKEKESLTGFQKLMYAYDINVDYTTDPQNEYSYSVFVSISHGDPATIRKFFTDDYDFKKQRIGSGQSGDFSAIENLGLGQGGYVQVATRAGGMNHFIAFYKNGFLVVVRSSPWAGGLDIGKKTAALVAARIR